MTAFHRKRIVDEFRQHGGTLTGPQIAAAVGFGWRRDIHEMRKADYLIVEDAAGLWHLDLEELPEPDVGRAAGHNPEGTHPIAAHAAPADSSPGTGTLFDPPAPAGRSPYDTNEEAA